MPKVEMSVYTGTKTLKALPMNRGTYNIFRGWTIPEDEDPKEPGYLVEYQDGGKPNFLPQFQGYISWSPKDVFEKAYRLSETVEQLVRNEREDLAKKLHDLEMFLTSLKFTFISSTQQDLLRRQYQAMIVYRAVLDLRLKDFAGDRS